MQIFYSVAVSLLALYWWIYSFRLVKCNGNFSLGWDISTGNTSKRVYFGVLRSGFFIIIGGITNTENETEEAVYLRTGKN